VSFLPAVAQREPEREPRVVVVAAAGVQHRLGAIEQAAEVDGHQRRREEPEHRQRRVAAADRRLAREHPRTARARELLQRRAGIGDRDETVASLAAPPEEVVVRAGLERRPRFRGDDKERPGEVERIGEPPDRLRMRCVEHVETRGAEPAPEHLGRERRAPHPEEHHVVDLGGDAAGELRDLPHALAHSQRLVEPAEPVGLVAARPDGRVALPGPFDDLCGGDLRQRRARPAWRGFRRAAPRTSR
jgi:hypothetical protein